MSENEEQQFKDLLIELTAGHDSDFEAELSFDQKQQLRQIENMNLERFEFMQPDQLLQSVSYKT